MMFTPFSIKGTKASYYTVIIMNSTEDDDDESLDTRMAREEAENEYEKWRQKRREEWSKYKDDYATSDLQSKFQEISGIGDITTDIPLQLWIDRMVDKLQGKYYLLEDTISSEAKYTTVLGMIGFNQEFLDHHTDIDDDIGSHFSLVDMLEIMIDRVLYNIDKKDL